MSPGASRRRRLTLSGTRLAVSAGFLALACVVGLGPGPVTGAWAAGTGGIELTPLPAFDSSGHLVTAFHVSLPADGVGHEAFELRNLTSTAHSEEIYAASAAHQGGGYAIGSPGSAPWIDLPDQTVTLAPHSSQVFHFSVHRRGAPVGPLVYGAVVQVDRTSPALVTRVATLVYLSEPGPSRVVPIILVAVAAALVLGAAGLTVMRSRRPGPGATSMARS